MSQAARDRGRGLRSAQTKGVVERTDGRMVAWARWGVAGGRPLLWLHGTPGCRLIHDEAQRLYEHVNADVVSFDRPGYGRSSPHRDLSVLSVAEDALAVADAAGWHTFAVAGISGGGPYALAIAFREPARVTTVGLIGGATPTALEDPDELLAINREARRRALEEGRASYEEYGRQIVAEMDADLEAASASHLGDAPEADREAERDPERQAYWAATVQEALRQGPEGWFDDGWAQMQPWGFELSQIETPVHMWYGDLDRAVSRRAVDRMAAALKTAHLELFPDEGHTGWRKHHERILCTLLDEQAARAAPC